jgi:septal ring factor EnvC (AmiA/AmiB activator)
MSAPNLLAEGSALMAIGTAASVFYRGWRNRVSSAAAAKATAPYTTGHAAVDEAELALRLKDQRLAATTAELEEQRAKNSAQAGQINELYTELGKMTAKNAELEEQLRQAKVREESDRARIGTLEMQLEGVMKQLGLGHG